MLECLILGDSIAVGVHNVAPQCAEYAVGGLNTWQWNKKFLKNDLSAKTVVISLGSNDHKYIKTQKELEVLRAKVQADNVYWVLPAGNLKASEVDIKDVQNIVYAIAHRYGDTVIPIKNVSPDRIHPAPNGYKQIAKDAHILNKT